MASPHIYLSYAQQDRAEAASIDRRLREAGYNPWRFDSDILPGEMWEQRIEESIIASDLFMPLVSEHWLGTGYFDREIDIALGVAKSRGPGRVFIMPVMIRPSAFPSKIRPFFGIQLYQDGGWEKLLRALGKTFGLEEHPAPEPPEGLIHAFTKDQTKPFVYVGAGLSVPMGLPMWKAFASRLLEWADSSSLIRKDLLLSLHQSLDAGDADVVADTTVDVVRGSSGERELISFLHEIFTGTGLAPGANHRRIQMLGPGAVLTTNIDNLLEQTFVGKPVYTHLDTEPLLNALSARTFFVLKLYGTLDRPNSVVVSPRQYEDSIVGNLAFSQFMENMFVSRTLLFLGASLEGIEAYLRGIKFRGTLSRQHYALVAVNDATWRAKAESLRRRYQIEVIPYTPSPDHTEVDHFLDAISSRQRKSTAGSRAVTERKREFEPSGIANVRLENLGPFDDLSLALDRHWNILLGSNGVGKSNVLRAIAAGVCGRDAQPYADRIIKYQRPRGRVIFETADGKEYVTQMDRSSSVPQIESIPGRILDIEGCLMLGFPALRTVTWRRARGPQLEERKTRPNPDDMLPLVAGGPDPRMDELKQWIVDIDYRVKDESNPNRQRYVGLLDDFFNAINRVTEGLKLKFQKVDLELGHVVMDTDDGPVPLEAISQGTISLFGWIGVLMQRLYEIYEGEAKPIEQYALVLIDEIDAHMHPYWQLRLVPLLRKIFPKVQFIATTHSPLVVCNVGDGAVFRFERDESTRTLTARRFEASHAGLGAEGLLTSEYFGLPTQLDDETQKLIDKKVEYVAREEPLNGKEKKELEDINRRLDEVGLLTTFADPYYTAFLRALARRGQLAQFKKPAYTASELEERRNLIEEILDELKKEGKKSDAVR